MPADRTELLALAARAEAGGDDRLSDDVWRAMGWRDDGLYDAREVWLPPERGNWVLGPRPDLTTSIDAQEALPARITTVTEQVDGSFYALAYTESGHSGSAVGPSEAAARLAAKLRAMAAATPEERT